MSNKPGLIHDTTDPRRVEHADEIQRIQRQLDALKLQYDDGPLARQSVHYALPRAARQGRSVEALNLAWEATRVAWYGVHQETADHLGQAEDALWWLKTSAYPDRGDGEVTIDQRD